MYFVITMYAHVNIATGIVCLYSFNSCKYLFCVVLSYQVTEQVLEISLHFSIHVHSQLNVSDYQGDELKTQLMYCYQSRVEQQEVH